MVAIGVTGIVKWFNVKAGYGFIIWSDTNRDVFVHKTAIVRNNPNQAVSSLGEGESVEFDVVLAKRGLEASNVSGLDGAPVEGSPYAPDKPVLTGASYRPHYVRHTSAALDLPGDQSPPPPSYYSSSESLAQTPSHTFAPSYSRCPGEVAHQLDSFACRDPDCVAQDGSFKTSSSESSCSTPPPPLGELDDDTHWLFRV